MIDQTNAQRKPLLDLHKENNILNSIRSDILSI